MAEIAPTIDEPTTEQPIRYWWLKRLTLAYVVAMVLLAVGWLVWSWDADRRLSTVVESLRQQQEPVSAEDFTSAPPIPANENAARVLAPAMVLTFTDEQVQWMGHTDWITLPAAEDMAVARTFITRFPKELAAVHQARSFTHADFRAGLSGNPSTVRFNYEFRDLANLCMRAAAVERADGDFSGALETYRDLLHLAVLLNESFDPSRHLWANNINAIVAGQILDQGALSPGNATTQPTHAASADQIRGIIDDLLNEQPYVNGQLREWRKLRVDRINDATAFRSSRSLPWDVWPWFADGYLAVLRPELKLTTVSHVERCTMMIKAIESSDFAKAQTAFPFSAKASPRQWNDPESPLLMSGHLLDYMNRGYYPSNDEVWRHFSYLANTRAAALKLAIELYQQDHANRLPVTLDALVPQYIPAVPIDACSLDGSKVTLTLRPYNGRNPGAFMSCAFLMYGIQLHLSVNLPSVQTGEVVIGSSSPSTRPANTPR